MPTRVCDVKSCLAFLLVVLAVVGGWAGSVGAQSAGPIDFLKRLDRSLCDATSNTRCKGKRRARAARKTPDGKPAAAPDAVDAAAADDGAIVKPRLRPAREAVEEADVASRQVDGPLVLPKLRPAGLPPLGKVVKPVLKAASPASAKAATKVVVVMPPAGSAAKPRLPDQEELGSSCLKALKAAGASFTAAAQPVAAGACDVNVPVKLAGLMADGHVVALPDQPLLACAFALRFAQWLDERGQPLAKATAGSSISRVYTGPGFDCRGRNGDISSKISEHGYGNAVDIERIKLVDGREFWVKDAGNRLSASYGTLKALRQSACERFTTVLGPGSNTAHEEHFHFDLGRHGKSGTYVICQ